MANTKKNAPAAAKEIKAAAATAAAETAVPAETPKAEETKPAKRTYNRKNSAEKKAAEKKPAAKKTTEKKASEKADAKKPAAKKPASRKSAPKGITFDMVVEKTRKKVLAANTTRIKFPIAANIVLTGSCDGIFYIYMDEGKIAVEPFKYDDYDVNITVDTDAFVKVIEGKLNVYDALSAGDMKIDGMTKKAVLFVDAAF